MKFRRWLSKNLLGIEHRSSLAASYSSWLLSQAASGPPITASDVRRTAVIESCAGLAGRMLSQAQILPTDDPRTKAISSDFLLSIGRSCVRDGEVLYEIVLKGGEVRLIPCSDFEIVGSSPFSEDWKVRLSVATPSSLISRTVSYQSVVHITYSTNAGSPWAGSPAWVYASDSSKLLASLERRLSEEAGSPVGNLLPIPSGSDSGSEDNDDSNAKLRTDLAGAKGQTLLVESTSGGWESGPQSAPKSDWVQRRIGAHPPSALIELRRDAERSILRACGIGAGLFDSGERTSQQAWRQYLRATLMPFARRVERELSEKLDLEIRLDLSHLTSTDALPQSRVVKTLTDAGVELSQAMKIAGLGD